MLNKLISLKNIIWVCAIGLAVFSGYYSVYGIAKLFSGGSWSIMGMAGMLEFSKLVVITFLHDNFKTLKKTFKVYLLSAAIILMILTSVGVYGYLTNSYQETAKSINETRNKISLIEKKKVIFVEQKRQVDTLVIQKTQRISSYDKLRLSQENFLNTQLSQQKGTRGLQKNIQSVDNSTQTLNREISELNQKSISLSDSISTLEQTKIELENKTFSSELGPLLYLSRLTDIPMDVIVNWFILVLVLVFDPLAVSLVIAANHLKLKEREQKKLNGEEDKTNSTFGFMFKKNKKKVENDKIQKKIKTRIVEEIVDNLVESPVKKEVIEDVVKNEEVEKSIEKILNEPSIAQTIQDVYTDIDDKIKEHNIPNNAIDSVFDELLNQTKISETVEDVVSEAIENKEMSETVENIAQEIIEDPKKSLENSKKNRILSEDIDKSKNEFYYELPGINRYRRGRKN
jgi:hypothetical protein